MSPGQAYLLQRLEGDIVQMLGPRLTLPLGDQQALEVGCGSGYWLRFLARLGARQGNLHGIDIRGHRLARARSLSPEMNLVLADGERLPYPDSCFDLVLQFTLFTSILDRLARQRMAQEMLRVLKPGGIVLWYDFIFNPLNRQTRGIAARELASLFPGCPIEKRRVTLLPPLSRRLARLSPLACSLLEGIPLLRTHYLAVIRKGGG